MHIHLISQAQSSLKGTLMKLFFALLAALLLFGILFVTLRKSSADSVSANSSESGSSRPDLEYLKAINTAGPPQDPQILFLLMAQYSSANLQGEGADFL